MGGTFSSFSLYISFPDLFPLDWSLTPPLIKQFWVLRPGTEFIINKGKTTMWIQRVHLPGTLRFPPYCILFSPGSHRYLLPSIPVQGSLLSLSQEFSLLLRLVSRLVTSMLLTFPHGALTGILLWLTHPEPPNCGSTLRSLTWHGPWCSE